MLSGMVQGATRVIGKSQGYLGLAVRDEKIACTVNGPDTPAMTTAWHPTPKEIEAIRLGAPIHVRILGTTHPPIMVDIGLVPCEADHG